jgi:hypothetical protein
VIDLAAWEQEPRTKDENLRTAGASKGWTAWNGRSPEREFCTFAKSLVRLVRPKFLIETGVGQGYMTRRLAEGLPEGSQMRCYESDHEWREALGGLDFWTDAISLSGDPTPASDQMALCELLVADSTYRFRKAEIELWWKFAPAGSYLLIHDVSPNHNEATVHHRLDYFVRALEIPGVLLPNPRGGFLGRK